MLEPGTQTTIQDYPGRLGYWHVGVPPSGPMDNLAFRFANRFVGNAASGAALEIALTGPTLRFASDVTIALTGADFGARLDGQAMPLWREVLVTKDSVLELGTAQAAGARCYLAVSGGIVAPQFLGSGATFILGKFGGQAGRALRAGDVLRVGDSNADLAASRALPPGLVPQYGREWEIGVMYGPHGAPDFLTPEDVDIFFSALWKVHYNSDRTGVRSGYNETFHNAKIYRRIPPALGVWAFVWPIHHANPLSSVAGRKAEVEARGGGVRIGIARRAAHRRRAMRPPDRPEADESGDWRDVWATRRSRFP